MLKVLACLISESGKSTIEVQEFGDQNLFDSVVAMEKLLRGPEWSAAELLITLYEFEAPAELAMKRFGIEPALTIS